nr:uncharacterized protein LOC116775000 [Danaus plexippus plexippus]
MCLNCLPYFEKCVFCINLRAAAIIISIAGVIITTCVLILTCVYHVGLTSQGSIDFSLWLKLITVLWLVTFILIFLVWTGLVQNEDVRDILLQIYFWLSVVVGLIQLIFCILLLISCWNGCLDISFVYIGVTLIIICVMAYILLVVNSYRMSLF